MTPPHEGETTRIGFGGGCHWCTEGVFQAVRGVVAVDQGYIRSDPPADAWSEGVLVDFSPAVVDLATLTDIHLRTHSGGGTYSPGGRYRSAVYTFDPVQASVAAGAIAVFAAAEGRAVRTAVLPFVAFRPSEARYRDYYRSDPEWPFCRRYIAPKLDYLRRAFADAVDG